MSQGFLAIKGTPKQIMEQINKITPEQWEKLKNHQPITEKGAK